MSKLEGHPTQDFDGRMELDGLDGLDGLELSGLPSELGFEGICVDLYIYIYNYLYGFEMI